MGKTIPIDWIGSLKEALKKWKLNNGLHENAGLRTIYGK